MANKKSSVLNSKTAWRSNESALAVHRLDALLHTMKCVVQYEDALCELSHEVKRTGQLSPEACKELRSLLEKLPTYDYVFDVEAVQDLLRSPTKRTNSKETKTSTSQKGSSSKKAIRRKPSAK